MISSFKDLKFYIYSDLYRRHGEASFTIVIKSLLWGACTKYQIWMRVCDYLYHKPSYLKPLFRIAWLFLRRYSFKFGIQISYKTEVGPGLFLPHFGTVIVSHKAKIGKNCNIGNQATIGVALRGKDRGECPVIGDNVYIGQGAKMFGKIKVGNNVAIGANSVVNTDIPDNAVVVGIPGKVVSFKGTEGIIEKTDYEPQ
ncbi:MAG: serine acetyltransferase [Planctomycetota bacterium]